MLDAASLSLPEEAALRIESALCDIRADRRDRKLKHRECCLQLYDVIAQEVLSHHCETARAHLEAIPDSIFDISVESGWIRVETESPAPQPAPRVIGYFSGLRNSFADSWLPESGRGWLGVEERWSPFRQPARREPARPPQPVEMTRLGHHDVPKPFADGFRRWFLPRIEYWTDKARIEAALMHLASGATDAPGAMHDTESTPLDVTSPTAAPFRQADEAGDAMRPQINVFRKVGEFWQLTFAGKTVQMKDRIGFHQLQYLLQHAGRTVHAIELSSVLDSTGTASVQQSGGHLLDNRAVHEFKGALHSTDEEIEEAQRNNDIGRLEHLYATRALLAKQLSAGIGLGNRRRSLVDSAERARKSVAASVKRAITSIEGEHRELGKHLRQFVSLGAELQYRNDAVSWNF